MIAQAVEADLVERARTGDTAAFEDLLRPLIAPACRLAYSMLRDWAESEDVVQDAALKAWRALPRLRAGTAKLRPWFLAIVANQARSVRRRKSFGTVTLGDLTLPSAAIADGGDARDQVLDLRQALAALSEAHRTLLFLHYGLDLPLDEIGVILGITTAAAKSKLYRALRAIRAELEASEG